MLCVSKLGDLESSAGATALSVGLGLIAGFTYASYSWTAHHLMGLRIPRAASMGAVLGCGGLLLMPVLLTTGAPLIATHEAFLVATYMALVPMFLCYVLLGFGLARMPASAATTITLTEPTVAAMLAVAIVGETLTPLGWTGLAIIAVTLVILSLAPTNGPRGGQHEQPPPPAV